MTECYTKPQVSLLDDHILPKRLEVYTDGACHQYAKSSGAGGWAFVMIYQGKTYQKSNGDPETTNNRMEMEAIIRAIEVYNKSLFQVDEIIIHSDSEYALNMLSGRYRVKSHTKNKDLIHRFSLAIKKCSDKGTNIIYKKVKAHSGNHWNEVVDELANQEMYGCLDTDQVRQLILTDPF